MIFLLDSFPQHQEVTIHLEQEKGEKNDKLPRLWVARKSKPLPLPPVCRLILSIKNWVKPTQVCGVDSNRCAEFKFTDHIKTLISFCLWQSHWKLYQTVIYKDDSVDSLFSLLHTSHFPGSMCLLMLFSAAPPSHPPSCPSPPQKS